MSDHSFTKIRDATLADEEMQSLTAAIRNDWKNPKQKESIRFCRFWYRFRDALTIVDDIILKDGAIVIPKSIRRDILIKAQSTHQGIVRTKQCLRNVVFWCGMSSEIEEMCKDCRICQQLLPRDELPLSPVQRPEVPWLQMA